MPWLTGYLRETIEWYPTIDPEQYVECAMCMNCGRRVYDWTDKGPKVVHLDGCVVGCTTCASLCARQAISFPNVERLRELHRREKIWAKVKEHLIAQGVIS